MGVWGLRPQRGCGGGTPTHDKMIRMKRLLKVALGLALVAALLAVCVLFYAWSWLTPERLGPLLAGLATDRVNAEIRLGSAEVAFPGSVVVADVSLTERGSPRNRIAAKRVRLELDFLSLLSGSIQVSGVVVEEPALSLVIERDGSIRLFNELAEAPPAKPSDGGAAPPAPRPAGGGRTNLSVSSVKIEGGTLDLRDESGALGRTLKMKGIAVDLSPDLAKGAALFTLDVAEPGLTGRIRASGAAAANPFNVEMLVKLDRVDLAEFAPELRKDKADVALADLSMKVRLFAGAGGALEADASLERAVWEGTPFSAAFRKPAAGRVEATLRVERLELARIEKAFRTLLKKKTGLPELPALTGTATADLALSLAPGFTDPRVSGRIELKKAGIRWLDLPEVRLDAECKIDGTTVRLESFAAAAPGVILEAGGTFDPFALRGELAARKLAVDAEKLVVPEGVRAAFPLPTKGRLAAAFALSGPLAKPEVKGRLDATGLTLPANAPLPGVLDLTATLERGNLVVEKATFASTLFGAGIAGRIDDVTGKRRLALKARARGIDAGRLLEAAGVAGLRGAGTLALTAEVAGTAERPTLAFKGGGEGALLDFFSVETGKTYLKLPFDALALHGTYDAGELSASLEPALFAGKLRAELGMTAAGEFPFRLAVKTTAPPDLAAFLAVNPYARKALEGRLTVTLSVAGGAADRESWRGGGECRFDRLVLDGKKLFGKLAPYIPNLAQETFEEAGFKLALAGVKLDLTELTLENADLKWEGGAAADLSTFALAGDTRLTLFPAAVKGSGIEANFPPEGVTLKVPVSGTLFSPEISAALDVSALMKTAGAQKAADTLKEKAEEKLLNAILGKKKPKPAAPAGTTEVQKIERWLRPRPPAGVTDPRPHVTRPLPPHPRRERAHDTGGPEGP